MVLDLPKNKGVANIPNVLKGQNVLIPTGYGTAATNQTENFKQDAHGNNTDYEEIYTVPTGKTFYVTTITYIRITSASAIRIATGGAASEVDALVTYLAANTSKEINFLTPIKFASGTRISWKTDISAVGSEITLIGWEE